jgi:hypothetical protein
MRLAHAFLVIVDISGYTAFINERQTSLLHAEQIITELMEAVIDRAAHPLTVNKLEGDAALLYGEVAAGDQAGARDVLAQVKAFFPAFAACLGPPARGARQLRVRRLHRHRASLQLKAFVHVGELAVKRVRQFEELAGEEVILVHRLLKNTCPARVRAADRAGARRGRARSRLLERTAKTWKASARRSCGWCARRRCPSTCRPRPRRGRGRARFRPRRRGFGRRLRAWLAGG